MIKKISGLSPQRFSMQHCNRGTNDCSWYHGSWHLLRELGIISTAGIHGPSISRLLKTALSNRTAPRILITGSADETVVHLAHTTCLELGVEATIQAVDICATPLAFMQDYASRKQVELTTTKSDILDYETQVKYDIILTHAFMGNFDAARRPLLIKKWCELLVEGGRVVTIQRVRPPDTPALVTFSDQQATAFVKAAMEAAKHLATDSDLNNAPGLEMVQRAATEFSRRFVCHAISCKTALESLFTDAGMSFIVLEYQSRDGVGEMSGPSVPSKAEFAHIVAEK